MSFVPTKRGHDWSCRQTAASRRAQPAWSVPFFLNAPAIDAGRAPSAPSLPPPSSPEAVRLPLAAILPGNTKSAAHDTFPAVSPTPHRERRGILEPSIRQVDCVATRGGQSLPVGGGARASAVPATIGDARRRVTSTTTNWGGESCVLRGTATETRLETRLRRFAHRR